MTLTYILLAVRAKSRVMKDLVLISKKMKIMEVDRTTLDCIQGGVSALEVTTDGPFVLLPPSSTLCSCSNKRETELDRVLKKEQKD